MPAERRRNAIMKPILTFLVVAAAIALLIKAIPEKTYVIEPTPVFYQKGTPKMEAWLTALRKHENCPPEGIIDSNGLRSYGPYCFQAATFAMFKKQFAPTSTASIADPAFGRWLTMEIVTKVPNGALNWATSVRRIGLPPLE